MNSFLMWFSMTGGIGARIVDAELAKYIMYEKFYERFLFIDDRI